MNYATVEEAYGAPFGKPVKVQSATAADTSAPIAPFSSLAKRAEESKEKNQGIVDNLMKSLPLAKDEPAPPPAPPSQRERVRETFATSQPAGVYAVGQPTPHDEADKLSRILRLIEQNRTGYERPSVQDMGLYVFTGVFFLFTFDTFVQIGKVMGRQRT